MNELPYETKARGASRSASQATRGRDGARWTDTVDKEIAAAMDEAARLPLCIYHETRAASRPPMVRATLWRGLVTRWAKQKCAPCRGIVGAPPARDDGLDAMMRDVRETIETRRAGRNDDDETGRADGLARLKRAILGARGADDSGAVR